MSFHNHRPNHRSTRTRAKATLLTWCVLTWGLSAGLASSQPVRAKHGMVVAQERIAAEAGLQILKAGGNAVDASIATAFALAVTHPAAGNIGGGGFLLHQPATGRATAYDFRERAPAAAHAEMFLENGVYSSSRHHASGLAIGVPGTVAGLHLAWQKQGHLPWRDLLAPAIQLARDGFVVSPGLSESLKAVLHRMAASPAAVEQFSKSGRPLEAGDRLRQPALARTLQRIQRHGPDGFYQGTTAQLIVDEVRKQGGILSLVDLAEYRAIEREPIRGTYRGVEVISMPPPSSGGIAIVEALNILEGWPLAESGFGSALTIHRVTESLRRAFGDRARYLGDPEANPQMPVAHLISKEYAAGLRKTISDRHASSSVPVQFEWPVESSETTHLSVVDGQGSAVSLTYTLEDSYGSKVVVTGGGFLLNNEMGDFNGQPGKTETNGAIGTAPNLAAPGKRMLSSMSPTILRRDGKLLLVTGSPGGRTIISTVLGTILDTIDFGMNAQEAVDAPRFHHQWLPDRLQLEANGFSADTLGKLRALGHQTENIRAQGAAQVIRMNATAGWLEGGADHRDPDSAASGW